jgi:hypothetical protein
MMIWAIAGQERETSNPTEVGQAVKRETGFLLIEVVYLFHRSAYVVKCFTLYLFGKGQSSAAIPLQSLVNTMVLFRLFLLQQ